MSNELKNSLRRLDAVIDKGECDFIEDIAGEMPSFVIADLMGLPLADGRELYRLTEVIHSDPSALPEGAAVEAITEMFEYGAGSSRTSGRTRE